MVHYSIVQHSTVQYGTIYLITPQYTTAYITLITVKKLGVALFYGIGLYTEGGKQIN